MTPQEPVQLGRYQILGELGRGAMGVVYLAEDPKLKRGVAIKVVMGMEATRQGALARFQREAESTARLHHPNIVSVFDVGEDPTFGPYLAMEYVEGESLQDKIHRGPLPHVDLINFISQGALALETAHRAGILHCDIKPGNFMVSNQGILKLMDFGIAYSAESPLASGVLCTPAYASPELLKGQIPTGADDRWAFAVTAFQCLTGRLPFGGTNIIETVSAIANASPAFPENLDPGLVRIFEKALAKDPALRHGDLRGFVMDLMAALSLDDENRATLLARLGWQDGVKPRTSHPASSLLSWRWIGIVASLAVLGACLLWILFPVRLRPISITSTPPGAEVRVDGSYLGLTPITTGYVPQKAKRLEVQLEGYVPLTRPLGPKDTRVTVHLEPLPWELDVRSDPAGAEVFLDGESKGTTPIDNLEVPGQGTHRLELELDGYRTWTMTISKNKQPPKTILLEPGPKGTNPLRKLGDKLKNLFN